VVVLRRRRCGLAQPGGHSCPDRARRCRECAAPGEGAARHLSTDGLTVL